MTDGVRCDCCGHLFENHTNMYGKICTRCGHFIEPMLENPIKKEHEDKLLEAQLTIKSYLKKYLKENDNAD